MNSNVEQWQISKRAVTSERGVIAAQHWQAAQAGAGMLADGGNAVDAAVAAAFALAAVEPWMCGLGGSGYMVVWRAAEKKAHVLDFQGMLPAAIDPADYPLDPRGGTSLMGFPAVIDQRNIVGYGSILVPGAVAGLSRAASRFGKLNLERVLQPAIALAERGLPVDWFSTLQIALSMPDLDRDAQARAIYLPAGAPPAPEQHLPLGKLAETLRMLASNGPDVFYHGELAAAMAEDLQAGGSRITRDDFAAYQVLEHAPLSAGHRGTILHTAGPTSGGPRLLEALAYTDGRLPHGEAPGPRDWQVYADALNSAWVTHKKKLGAIDQTGGCTSHLSTVDSEGNMVALTYTLLNRFGAAVALPQTGILMNNAVSYFDPRPGYPTSLEGHKRINASNMCPTIAERDGQALFAIGASGANHIMPCTMLIAALMLNHGLTLEEAFNHPRIDASDRGSVRVDPRLGEAVLAHLGEHYELETAQRLTFPKLYSCPSGVSRDPDGGLCYGINDPSQPIGAAAHAAPFTLPPAASSDVTTRA